MWQAQLELQLEERNRIEAILNPSTVGTVFVMVTGAQKCKPRQFTLRGQADDMVLKEVKKCTEEWAASFHSELNDCDIDTERESYRSRKWVTSFSARINGSSEHSPPKSFEEAKKRSDQRRFRDMKPSDELVIQFTSSRYYGGMQL